jgi:choline monooxygenase
MDTVTSQLERGLTLPASWYADPAVLERERGRIFARAWLYACHASRLERPGDFVAGAAAHIPFVVVRDADGDLRAFVNVCRHRGHEVISGCGNRMSLQCPYHAWTYALDGTLRAAPRSEREPGFDRSDWTLLPMRVDRWGPLVFVNAAADGPALAEVLGDVPARVAEAGVDVDALELHARSDWSLAANWKVAIENYLECYHCAIAHPGFASVIDVDPDAYLLTAGRWTSTQLGPPRDGNGGRPPAYDTTGPVRQAQYHFVWPATTVNVELGGANLSIDLSVPDGPDRTRGFTEYLFGPEVDPERRAEMMAFGQQVGAEDTGLVESVQRGLTAGVIPHGRLLLNSERLIAHFQRLVADALA